MIDLPMSKWFPRASVPDRLLLLALGAAAALTLSCGGREDESAGEREAEVEAPASSSWGYVDVTDELGIDFVHRAGGWQEHEIPAVMGGGLAVFDCDGDDDLDLYFVDSGDTLEGGGPGNRLYRQGEDGSFVDATAEAGVGDTGYGMGTAVGDVDNDGDLDLYVTNLGRDVFYRNRGDCTFEDATEAAGLGADGWSTSAIFVDLDADGWLDLFVTRYVDFVPGRRCAFGDGRPDFCGPLQYQGVHDLLFRNLGDGRFEDVSRESGIHRREDRGLGVAAADFDGNGRVDLYVANDADPNHLWLAREDGTLSEEGMLMGAAVNRFGVPEGGMGVALGDPDGDGDPDLLVSHIVEETNTFYRNEGALGFEDATAEVDLGVASVPFTGFGTAFFDGDDDGDLDLAVVNGAVRLRDAPLAEGTSDFWTPYEEPDLLFENLTSEGRQGRFADRSAESGAYGAARTVSRALAPVDLDGDGDLDLVVTSIAGAARVLRDPGPGGHAVQVRVIDPELRRDALGAVLVAEVGDRRLTRPVIPLQGYLTSGDATVHVGLGDAPRVDRFEVRWPSGETELFAGAEAGARVRLLRGEGESP